MGSVRFAVREVRRRAGRFVVLTGAITVLVFFLLFQQGLLSGLVTEFVGALRNQDADVLVYSEQARKNVQASALSDETVDEVAAVDGVSEAGPLGVGTFTVDTEVERADAIVFGHRLGGPGAPTSVVAGRRPEGPGEAVVSDGAGAGFGIGDRVAVVPGGEPIEIVGRGRDLSFSVLPTLFTSYDTFVAARLAQNPDARVVPPSAVVVEVAEGADPGEVADAIATAVPDTDPLTRAEAEAEAPGVQSVQQSFSIILVLGYVVVAVVLGFFFLILTTQKLGQLTLLRALGVSRRSLSGIVVSQVVVVLVIALLLGGGLAVQVLSSGASGIDAALAPSELVGAALIVLVLGLLAVTGSLRRIARIDPSQAVDDEGEL